MNYEHYDHLNQLIKLNQMCSFSSSYQKGVMLGKVIKITAKRVRIEYKFKYEDRNNNIHVLTYYHVAEPSTIIILNDYTQQYITMRELQL
jgi:hypothetical protein